MGQGAFYTSSSLGLADFDGALLQIWDACRLMNSHWFVLTNYHGWVLGKISQGWIIYLYIHSSTKTKPLILRRVDTRGGHTHLRVYLDQ